VDVDLFGASGAAGHVDRSDALEQGEHGPVLDEQAGAEVSDAFVMGADRETLEQDRAQPSLLPVVDDGDRGFCDVGAGGVAKISRYRQTLPCGRVDRAQRLVARGGLTR
jgi:hypothetical protein